MGDFNRHHFRWGHSDKCGDYGTSLVDMIDDLGLCVLNDGNPTRRKLPR